MKVDAFTLLLGGGAAVTLWYLLRESPAPSYAEPGAQQAYPPAPLPPSLQGLPPPPSPWGWEATIGYHEPSNANVPQSAPAPTPQPSAPTPSAPTPSAPTPSAPTPSAPTPPTTPGVYTQQSPFGTPSTPAQQQAAIDAAANAAQQQQAQQTSAPAQFTQANPPAPPPAGVPVSGFGAPIQTGRTSERFKYT